MFTSYKVNINITIFIQSSSCRDVPGRRERQEEENMLLYVGLGMSAVGLAVTFVGRSSVSIISITYNNLT